MTVKELDNFLKFLFDEHPVNPSCYVEDWLDKLEKHGMPPGWIGELPSEWIPEPIPPWLRG
jgi:hypothetical protein